MLPPLRKELSHLSMHLRSPHRSDEVILAFATTVNAGSKVEIEAMYQKYPDYKDRFDTVLEVHRGYITHLEQYNTRLQLALVAALRYLNLSSKNKLSRQDRVRLSRDRRTLRKMGVALGPLRKTKTKANSCKTTR